jgi:hypothetical protein
MGEKHSDGNYYLSMMAPPQEFTYFFLIKGNNLLAKD